jgi:predicted RNA-binding Zn-ribbon protein involved in translation (DUF1610 family)
MKYKVFLNNDRYLDIIDKDIDRETYPHTVLFETDEEPDFDSPLYEFRGNYYTVRCCSHKGGYIIVKECEYDPEVIVDDETFMEPEIVCPMCGYKENDSWEYDDSGDFHCPNCGSVSEYQREVEVTYTTTLKKKALPRKVIHQCIEEGYNDR